ncbi:MAG: tetratricopeptide repeat protein [Cyclobacteriaceae bacterium]|nr:tetratricopeptide repeat protein [Cyclobacteriaceae bacterium]
MKQPNQEKRAKRFWRLAIASAFLLALVWPLGSFIVWPLGGLSAYFIFLALYYSPAKPKGFTFQATKRREPSRANSTQRPVKPITPQQKRRLVFIVIAGSTLFIFIYFFVSLIQFVQSEGSGAIDETDRQTLAIDPNNLDALTNLGNDYYSNKQYDSALYYYNRVLQIDSENSSGLFNTALVFFQQKRYSQSTELLRRCIRLYPDNTDAYMLVGDNYYIQNLYSEALPWYRQAYDKGVRAAEMLNIMGYLYEQQNNTTESIRFYKETLRQDSSLVEVYDRLAVLDIANAGRYKSLSARWK